ncbi:hypothetical protein Tco_0515531, partial [Tanacetum coccineum]
KSSQDDGSKPSSDDRKKVDEDSRKDSKEDYSIFNSSRNDEDDGVEADMNNLDTTIQVSPIPTTRIVGSIFLYETLIYCQLCGI